ncbi:hypothetical protein B9G69_008440 [Bdellovibrio sp. SKB1291214]|uniref:hypothetical protein n=1 Tax=Bdellovibrio sp. SKB1291214 TaxID=1732569 RepID=UPI000B5153B7|nr:hypothetical protein [Bdellovibrio sp. SKB1291214]UYL10602.1 hypothetical protein B9G69_008440 [Bdellovibrio sp. SKB1291214]
MKKFILFSIMLPTVSSTIISCGEPPKKETGSSSTTPAIKDVNFDEAPKDTALFVGVQTRWEGNESGALSTHGHCKALTSVDSPEGPREECDILIPEGKLYYSDLIITLGSKLPATCAIVSFSVYGYQKSNSDDYIPPGESDKVKCATAPRANPACWGGAGPMLYSDYPKTGGQYIVLSGSTGSFSITIPSANSKSAGNNRATSNTLSAAGRVSNSVPGYVANSFYDYVISCRDIWAQPIYSFRLNIKDEDTEGTENSAPRDQIEDWQGY